MSQAGNYPDCEICEFKLAGGEAQAQAATTNNERVKSAPDVVESNDPCEYCDEENCSGCWYHGHFRGRRLSPVS